PPPITTTTAPQQPGPPKQTPLPLLLTPVPESIRPPTTIATRTPTTATTSSRTPTTPTTSTRTPTTPTTSTRTPTTPTTSSRTPTTPTTTTTRTTNTTTTTTTSTTHLSPWSGSTTSSTHKKNTNDSRLVVLGAPAVGKSALVVRLLTGRFIWEYDPTLEAAYRHHTTIDDDPAVMHIYDTAGQEEGLVNEGHARWGDGFLLAFSITDRRSFAAITSIHAAVAAARHTPNFSCVIVANKNDLGHLAEVSEEEANELAGELGASLFLTSACDGGPTIQAAFFELHRDVVRRRWSRRRRSSAKTVIEGFYKMFSR
ncbi:ras-related and estrogen-regulated growth inhibitor, partial [Procambarus clarkii]|uniref:ras-related and estrogen-regulated growth inhibitor n=1 Tax=Procambarus clarkii TaxID=6728 RepID=UPI0037445C3A